MTPLALCSRLGLLQTSGSITIAWASPLSSPQIREKLQQVISRRQEMNDKWEARSDRLHMREYSSGLGNLRAGPSRPLLEVQGTTPCVEETSWQYSVRKLWATGLRQEVCTDECSTLLPLPTLLLILSRPPVPSLVPMWSCGLGEVREVLVSPECLAFRLLCGGQELCPPAA